MKGRTPFLAGELWERVACRARSAVAAGKLIPLETDEEVIEEAGARFLLRQARRLPAKMPGEGQGEGGFDPFLPYDPDLFVANASATHVVLLNKFSVQEHHLLVVTREFEAQEDLLTGADFAAICRCLAERESLGFFNCGALAGASQCHKHLQLVPLPLSERTSPLPIAPLLDVRGVLPFRHAQRRIVRPADPDVWAVEAERAYRDAIAELGLQPGSAAHCLKPHNLLLTWDRLFVAPRGRERYHSISVNGLGFAGSFLVRSAGEADLVRRAGPLRVLQAVGT